MALFFVLVPLLTVGLVLMLIAAIMHGGKGIEIAGQILLVLVAFAVFVVLPWMMWYGANDRFSSEIIVGQCSITGVSIRRQEVGSGESKRVVWAGHLHSDIVTSEGVPIFSASPLGPEEQHAGAGMLSSFDQVVAAAMTAMNCPCAADQVPNIANAAFKCADEDENCECDGLVAYQSRELSPGQVGEGKALATAKDIQGSMRCSNDEFDNDPARGVLKQCICIPGYGALGHGGTSEKTKVQATRCAEEGGTCTCDGVVRYGTSECDGASRFSRWRPGMGIGLPCSNDMFDDPCGGEYKYCECVSSELVDKQAETVRVPNEKQLMGFPFFGSQGSYSLSCNSCADEDMVPPRVPKPCTFQHDEGSKENAVWYQEGAEVPSTVWEQFWWLVLAAPFTCFFGLVGLVSPLIFCKSCKKAMGPHKEAAIPRESMEIDEENMIR